MLNALFSPIGFQAFALGLSHGARQHFLKMRELTGNPWVLPAVYDPTEAWPFQYGIKRISTSRTDSARRSNDDTPDFADNAAGS